MIVGLLGLIFGCERPFVAPLALTFPAPTVDPVDTGSVDLDGASSGWIESTKMDDGFGASVAFGNQQIWIGAPFGDVGTVYRWIGTGLDPALTGVGKLGSHLAWTTEGLWASAPLTNGGNGAVLLTDGTVRFAGQRGTGIALTGTGSGGFAWESGWTLSSGDTETTSGRPTSIAIDKDGNVGVGMSHGTACFSVNNRTVLRPEGSDEAGFSLASSDLNGDSAPDWIVGAPGANQVFALDGNTLETIQVWQGSGRFGHAVEVCDDQNGTPHLVIGAPFASGAGSVSVFPAFAVEASETWSGRHTGAQLGTSLACMPDGVLAGAPGHIDRPASVLWARFGS